jgi:hypothetical protein
MTSLRARMRAPPTTEVCPNCRGQMTMTQVMPIPLTDGLESVTYKCTQCRSELERTFHPPGSKSAPHPEPCGGQWRRGGFERIR